MSWCPNVSHNTPLAEAVLPSCLATSSCIKPLLKCWAEGQDQQCSTVLMNMRAYPKAIEKPTLVSLDKQTQPSIKQPWSQVPANKNELQLSTYCHTSRQKYIYFSSGIPVCISPTQGQTEPSIAKSRKLQLPALVLHLLYLNWELNI